MTLTGYERCTGFEFGQTTLIRKQHNNQGFSDAWDPDALDHRAVRDAEDLRARERMESKRVFEDKRRRRSFMNWDFHRKIPANTRCITTKNSTAGTSQMTGRRR